VPVRVSLVPFEDVNERFVANALVEVDCVVVERVTLSRIVAPLNRLLSASSVEDAAVAPIHTLLIAKHPVAIEIPLPNVLVAVPDTVNFPVERFVEVALVVVLFDAVTSWSVDEPVARKFEAVIAPVVVSDPPVADVNTRFEVKRLVEVALVVVPVVTVSAAMVDDAFDTNPWKSGLFENTKFPVPVSSVMRSASSCDVSSDVEEILLLNTVKFADESLPFAVALTNGRLNVRVEPDPVIEKSVPVVDVARVTAGPVVVCPTGPIEVSAEVRPWVRHAPLYE